MLFVSVVGLGIGSGARPGDAAPLRVKRVVFTGLRTLGEAELQAAVRPLLPAGRVGAATRRRLARVARRTALRRLDALGYLRARIVVREDRPGPETSFVLLRVGVHEGPRYRVGALDVAGVGPASRLAALGRIGLRSGQFTGAGDLARDRLAVATVFADKGHAFVRVAVQRTPHRGQPLFDVTFHVRPGPRVRIGAIRVRGVSRTGAQLIRRALLLRPGSLYHRTTLRQALARLRRTGAFDHLRLAERPLGPARVLLTVTARDRRRSAPALRRP